MILKNILGDCFAKIIINVYDINTKQIVFTGGQTEVARFTKTTLPNITQALNKKYRIKNRYVVRYAK